MLGTCLKCPKYEINTLGKKVILGRKVALQGQQFKNNVNLGRKVALRGQKFIKKVNLGRKKTVFFVNT